MSAALSCQKPPRTKRPRFEVADIFRAFGKSYREKHSLNWGLRKIMRDIEYCRTEKFGGHLKECDQCKHREFSFNSCLNRHCPKCQALTKARWLEARKRDLLPVGYFHNVFTLPHELNPLILRNKRVLLNLLFQAVKETLKEFAQDPKHLGGKLGFITVLHTWDQLLNAHFHLHVIIPAGALAEERGRWIQAKRRKRNGKLYLFNIQALSRMFRGKYLDYLKQAYEKKKLKFSGQCQKLENKRSFQALLDTLYSKEWIVYSKEPFKGAEHVFDYLGRYTHRVAISNNRIIGLENGKVHFTYKNRDQSYQTETCVLPAELFISRFLLHELPSGFMRIRHYGFLASACKKSDLTTIRRLLGIKAEENQPLPKTTEELLLELTGIDVTLCSHCKKGTMRVIEEFFGPYGRPPVYRRKAPPANSS